MKSPGFPEACFSGSRAHSSEVRRATATGAAKTIGWDPSAAAILGFMFEVLVFVYENYWRGDACPELHLLERKLSAHGFEPDEIHQALVWLDGLNNAAESICLPAESEVEWTPEPSDTSMRVFSVAEQDHLGAECLGFLSFLESAGVLPPALREIVVDRAMAAPGDPVPLDALKIIVLMIYWRFSIEPDALILDELCEDTHERLAH